MKLKNIVVSMAPLFLLIVGNNAHAQASVNGNMIVSSILSPVCYLSVDNFGFTNVTESLTSGNFYTAKEIIITCTKTTAFEISLSSGESNDYSQRFMIGMKAGNSDKLKYNIYTDQSFSNIIGNGSSSTVTLNDIGTGIVLRKNIYAKINAQSYITPDNYNDNITVTINY